MNALHATRGGFIAPLEQKQEKVPTSRLKNSISTLSIFGIEISRTTSSYQNFCEKMDVMEKDFLQSLGI